MPFKIKTRLLRTWKNAVASGKFKAANRNTLCWSDLLLLPFILLAALIWFFLIRQLKMAGKGALSFGKSKARLAQQGKEPDDFQGRGRH